MILIFEVIEYLTFQQQSLLLLINFTLNIMNKQYIIPIHKELPNINLSISSIIKIGTIIINLIKIIELINYLRLAIFITFNYLFINCNWEWMILYAE